MSLQAHPVDVLDDTTARATWSGPIRLQYRTLTIPTSFEPAPVSRGLGRTILHALTRDDRLRWAYARRRWQGITD